MVSAIFHFFLVSANEVASGHSVGRSKVEIPWKKTFFGECCDWPKGSRATPQTLFSNNLRASIPLALVLVLGKKPTGPAILEFWFFMWVIVCASVCPASLSLELALPMNFHQASTADESDCLCISLGQNFKHFELCLVFFTPVVWRIFHRFGDFSQFEALHIQRLPPN